MLLFFILGYLGVSGFIVLGLMWASHKGDSVQIHAAPDDTLRAPEDRIARVAAPPSHSSGQTANLSKEEVITGL
jgi:hypothetical protein